MTFLNNKMSAGFAVVIALGVAASLGACVAPTERNYQLTHTQTVTDPTSGVRKQISHWQHSDGRITKSVKTMFRTDAGRSPRGTKGQRP